MTTDVTSCAKKSRGRPKVFDRDAALDKAMTLFWQHGYEATSLSDLVEATGAKAPTLYAEFTNKEGLFRAVLDRYISRFAAKHEAQLFCEEKSVEQALLDYFTTVATCFTSKDTPAGCFMINTSATLAASSREIANTVKSRHVFIREQVRIEHHLANVAQEPNPLCPVAPQPDTTNERALINIELQHLVHFFE